MNNLKISYRNLFKKRENNVIKIISLGIGLSVGLLLLAKVTFELNYDDFYPNKERIYQICANYIVDNKPDGQSWGISGGVALGFNIDIPEVEAATRFTYIPSGANYRTKDKNLYKASFILADENFFDVLPRPVVVGNWKEILSGNLQAMVSESVAEKMGGDVIDEVIVLESYPGKEIVIKGIFKDLPKNSHIEYDIIVSLESISNFIWDGRQNWDGNERYLGYAKLYPDTDPASLTSAIRTMHEKYLPWQEMLKSGIEITYLLKPITKIYLDDETVKITLLILGVIAFILITTALLNYILIVISSIIERSRQIAVYRCFGASGSDIAKISIADTLIHFVLALIVAMILLFAFRSISEELLGIPILALLTLKSVLILIVILAIMFTVAVFTSTSLQSGISLVVLFKKHTASKKRWKLALLFIQIMASALLFTLLVMINRQYNRMINDDPGYSFQNVIYTDLPGVKNPEKQKIIDKIRQYPFVEAVSQVEELPLNYMSGNNISIPGDEKELFNVADMYYTDEHFIPLFEIEIIDGKNFSESNSYGDILVNRRFKEKMKTLLGWEEIVGREVVTTESGLCRIVGVFEDIRLTSIISPEDRPAVLRYNANNPYIMDDARYIVMKLEHMSAENIKILYDEIAALIPDIELILTQYSDRLFKMYNPARNIKNTILIGGLITIIITLIGLIGYVNNEILRKKYEIAVRRINGATIKEIIVPFTIELLYISFPAATLGVIVSFIALEKILSNFSEKATTPLYLYCLCGLFVLAVIEVIVVLICQKISTQNPVDSLKSE